MITKLCKKYIAKRLVICTVEGDSEVKFVKTKDMISDCESVDYEKSISERKGLELMWLKHFNRKSTRFD